MHKKGSSPSSTPAAKESVVSRQPCPNHGSPQAACVPPAPKQLLPRLPIFCSTTLYSQINSVKAWFWPRGWWWRLWWLWGMMIRTPLHPRMESAVVSLGIRNLQSCPQPVYCTSVHLYGVCLYVYVLCTGRIHILYTHRTLRTHTQRPTVDICITRLLDQPAKHVITHWPTCHRAPTRGSLYVQTTKQLEYSNQIILL